MLIQSPRIQVLPLPTSFDIDIITAHDTVKFEIGFLTLYYFTYADLLTKRIS
jgi:hypothetical protein